MAVVIRLQGLSGTAGSGDIRRFFTGLKIPEGGVHIIGGKQDEAFIIFATDEDARRAMTRSGGFIKDLPVTLLLSSKAEMQKVLERTAQNVEEDENEGFEEGVRYTRRSADPEVGPGSFSQSGYSPDSLQQTSSNPEEFFGVFLKGLPFSVTGGQIRDFFNGINIDKILLLKNNFGRMSGQGFVRFQTKQDVIQAIKRDRQYIGPRYIEVRRTYASDWHRAVEKMQMDTNKVDYFEKWRSPGCNQSNPHRDRSRSPVAQRQTAPSDEEYCVMLENLPFSVEKEHIKDLFPNTKLENDQILFLTDSRGRRTRSAFVLFRSLRDYCEALSCERRQLWDRNISTRPVSRENMIELLGSQSQDVGPSGSSERYQEGPSPHSRDPYDFEKACMFIRNLPFDVRKVEIIDFFRGFNVSEDRVQVLLDCSGAGVGQALVVFGSEAEAMEALSLNGRQFLGSEVMMRCITRSQMEQLAAETLDVREPMPREERYSGRSSKPFCPPGNTSYPDASVPRGGSLPMTNMEGRFRGGPNNGPRPMRPRSPRFRGNGVDDRCGSPTQRFNSPTRVMMVNLPFQIRCEEIYDFCYGYPIVPGSVSLQYEPNGAPKGSATLAFESHQEALTAIRELSGRPIGPRKIQLFLA
ncbi:RNA-binding protein 12-like [Kryptolebias marmoratus]|uniref:RNA binding motif protein 12Bb n=1 Tax=Kryptolebias marmoratus TaxID=37003 RepID=A0A3Q3ANL4_KRYMA|nr:RNA-binding protein 12-like [Kryptolebias marmoratus]